MTSQIAAKADFDDIRYAQLWEDADVLTGALDTYPGALLVSICSAGDNALAMLTLDPERVVVVDLSKAQIECLNLRIGAYTALEHQEFLELMGSRPSKHRRELLTRALTYAGEDTRHFWKARERGTRNVIASRGLEHWGPARHAASRPGTRPPTRSW